MQKVDENKEHKVIFKLVNEKLSFSLFNPIRLTKALMDELGGKNLDGW